MMQMCKPRRTDADGTVVWWEDDDRISRLQLYCDQDVETETDVDRSIPELSPEERRVWELDQKINDRGVMIDVSSVSRCLAVVEEAIKRADDRMWWLTDGEVKKCSEAAKLVKWLTDRGIPCSSVAKGEVEEIVLMTSIMGDEIAEEAVQMTVFEDYVQEKVMAGRSVLGLYPPTDADVAGDFAAWRAAKGR